MITNVTPVNVFLRTDLLNVVAPMMSMGITVKSRQVLELKIIIEGV